MKARLATAFLAAALVAGTLGAVALQSDPIGDVAGAAGPATAGGATGGTSWSAEHTPNPTVADGYLLAESCAGRSWCVAVGTYRDTPANPPLIEVWHGGTWHLEDSPTVGGDDELDAVSCSSPSACTAVGLSAGASGTATLAMGWDGSTWVVEPTPSAGASSDDLTGVSCTSATACVAVGTAETPSNPSQLLAEAWNGTTWALLPQPVAPSSENWLGGISCPSAEQCTAVGWTGTPASESPLAEGWDGSSWTTQSVPAAGGDSESLQSVSCPSARACTAVGSTAGGLNPSPVADHWTGGAWVQQAVPLPTGATTPASLSGVSCPGPDRCTAIGGYTDQAGTQATLGEAWNGSTWSATATQDPTGTPSPYLLGVSCPSPRFCSAIGSSTPQVGQFGFLSFAEAWDGSGWNLEAVPPPAGRAASVLAGASCWSPGSCTAVGWYFDGIGVDNETESAPLIEMRARSAWRIEPAPVPTGATSSQLNAVSCPSADLCLAVGVYDTLSAESQPFDEVWQGSSWSVQTMPLPAGAAGADPVSVSCTASPACTTVGDATGPDGPLVEQWSPSGWAVQRPAAPPAGTLGPFIGVSCFTTGSCTAVATADGAATGTDQLVTESWNGSSWSAAGSTPLPAQARVIALSCTSPDACTTVGVGATGNPVAMSWDGSVWSAASVPAPPSATSAVLAGVSCAGARACTAVGYDPGTGSGVFAETWDGSAWTEQDITIPGAESSTDLVGVSCPTAARCVAVGRVNELALALGN